MLRECGARARRNGMKPCRRYAMANGRCHLHGGKCTGPKTPDGIARIKAAKTKHGFYSAGAIAERKYIREFMRTARAAL